MKTLLETSSKQPTDPALGVWIKNNLSLYEGLMVLKHDYVLSAKQFKGFFITIVSTILKYFDVK